MKSFARKSLASLLLAVAFLMETFWTLIGLAAITIGAFKIYTPAGWIVGGLLLVVASEFQFSSRNQAPPVSGGSDGAI